MKSELINLLDRLKALATESASGPNRLQSLTIFPNGSAHAQYRWGIKQFQTLDQLEALAYPDSVGTRSTASHELQPARNAGQTKTFNPVVPCPGKE